MHDDAKARDAGSDAKAASAGQLDLTRDAAGFEQARESLVPATTIVGGLASADCLHDCSFLKADRRAIGTLSALENEFQ
jgi:hypothetical protein